MYTSTKSHAPLFTRLKNAVRGFVVLIAEEISYVGCAVAVAALVGFIYFISPGRVELMVLSLAAGVGVLAAAFNFVVEELCDLYSTEYSERIRKIKDVAAGGCAFFFASFITILVLMAY